MPTDSERLDWLEAHGMPGFRGFIDERMRPAAPQSDQLFSIGHLVIINLDEHRLIKSSPEGWLVECKIVGKKQTADVWFRAANGCRMTYKLLYIPKWVWEAKKLTIGEIEVSHVPTA